VRARFPLPPAGRAYHPLPYVTPAPAAVGQGYPWNAQLTQSRWFAFC
jgi:hypothetical protein